MTTTMLEQDNNLPNQVAEQVHGALSTVGYTQLRNVKVTPIPGGIRLTGSVSSYYLKQLAQTVAMRMCGDSTVISKLEVQSV